MLRNPGHPAVLREIKAATKAFNQATKKDHRLPVLALVDPIRAFSDAGIKLGSRARKHFRRAHPNYRFGDNKLYEQVRDGKVKLPWIREVRISRRSGHEPDDEKKG